MERVSNISVWQLRLFEGFDRDIMVMQRDEEEVFDEALHVFLKRITIIFMSQRRRNMARIATPIMRINWARWSIRFLRKISKVWCCISARMMNRRKMHCVMSGICRRRI